MNQQATPTMADADHCERVGNRTAFHLFLKYGSSVLFRRYVVFHTAAEEAQAHMHEMEMVGFPSCVSSTDTTHITMNRCSNKHCLLHVGFMLKFPSRAYNVSVNHKWQILFSTDGHPASWNDKTLQEFDKVMGQIQSGHLFADVKFILYDRNAAREILKVQYSGA